MDMVCIFRGDIFPSGASCLDEKHVVQFQYAFEARCLSRRSNADSEPSDQSAAAKCSTCILPTNPAPQTTCVSSITFANQTFWNKASKHSVILWQCIESVTWLVAFVDLERDYSPAMSFPTKRARHSILASYWRVGSFIEKPNELRFPPMSSHSKILTSSRSF
jgi:hypothetical protein